MKLELRSPVWRLIYSVAAILLVAVVLLASPNAARAATPAIGSTAVGAAALSQNVPGLQTTNGIQVVELKASSGMEPRAATRNVCTPKKCITVASSKYCPVTQSGCGNYRYKAWPAGTYCSASVGCFTLGGKNYSAINGPRPTAAQQNATLACAASLGLAVTSFYTGPLGWAVAGVAVAAWGCSTI